MSNERRSSQGTRLPAALSKSGSRPISRASSIRANSRPGSSNLGDTQPMSAYVDEGRRSTGVSGQNKQSSGSRNGQSADMMYIHGATPDNVRNIGSDLGNGVGGGNLQEMAAAKANETDVLGLDKQSLCISILTNGYVNSFVDFFYLTHRATETGQIPEHQMEFIKTNLTNAEKSHRRGLHERVFDAYEKLAGFFQSSKDYKTAGYFYEKCLDIAESMEDLAQQGNSNLHLGLTHDLMGQTKLAIQFHERHLQIALELDDPARLEQANLQLVEAYFKFAQEFEAKSGPENARRAVVFYRKCVEAAAEARQLKEEGTATYRLGITLARLGELEDAIEHQQKYLAITTKLGDALGEGNACYELAESFRRMGEMKLAISHLLRYNRIAMQTQQFVAQAKACAALGAIYSNLGEHQQAVTYLEQTFEVAKTVGDRKLVDSARINLGMARGNMALNPYMDIVSGDLRALLQWKTRRSKFN